MPVGLFFVPANWQYISYRQNCISNWADGYFHVIYKAATQHLFSNRNHRAVWNDNSKHLPSLFVCFLQAFSENIASLLSSSAFIAYPIHALLLNMIPWKLEWLINHCYTIIAFLPFSMSEYDVHKEDLAYEMNSTDTDGIHVPVKLDDDFSLTPSSDRGA